MEILGLDLTPQLGMAFRPSTETVLAAELLALPEAALAERLLAEAGRNPALIVERDECPDPQRRVSIPRLACAAPLADPGAPEHPAVMLVADAAPSLRPEDRPVALELAFGLDRRGFLPAPADELARAMAVSPVQLGRVIAALQQAGPVGVATEGSRACVIAQLRALQPPPPWTALAIGLVEHHLEELAKGRLDAAARSVGVGRREVEEALAGVRRYTRPYPAWDPPGCEVQPAPPDVIVEQVGRRLQVRLADEDRLTIRVDERMRGTDRRLVRDAREAEAWTSRVTPAGDALSTRSPFCGS
jgi:hypothetical protein